MIIYNILEYTRESVNIGTDESSQKAVMDIMMLL